MNSQLSIIIVSYNTKDLTLSCLDDLVANLKENSFHSQIIVIDNGSMDDSYDALVAYKKTHENKAYSFIVLKSEINLGFGKANNKALERATGKYILFLNSDVLVGKLNFKRILDCLETDVRIGVLTVKVVLKNGILDMASHRGFPTLWRSFTYFAKLEKLLGKIKPLSGLFGGYHLLSKDFETMHEIDSPTGAFYLTRKEIMDKTSGFDPDYFFYGEDLDLSFRIKKLGFSIVYFPFEYVTHLKNQSGIKSSNKQVQDFTRNHFYGAMSIFYKKHYAPSHSSITNTFVYFIINVRKILG